MTTPAHQAEADRVENVYRWALVQVGVSAISDSLSLWATANPTGGNYAAWLRGVERLVTLRSRWLREVAVAYYRLVRALRTGRSFSVDGDAPTLDTLRDAFDRNVDQIALHRGASPKAVPTATPAPARARDTKPLPLDDAPDLESIAAQVEQDVLDQVRTRAPSLGPQSLAQREADRGLERPARVVDAERAAARATAGRVVSADIERMTLLAARRMTFDIAKADRLAMGWVRYSTTGTPCGWCAMLLTRGFIPTKSGKPGWLYDRASSATTKQADSRNSGAVEVGEQFHPNCHCIAVPIFSERQLDSSLFDLNRRYAQEWPEVTSRANGTEDVMTLWRRHIRAQQGTSEPALEAA